MRSACMQKWGLRENAFIAKMWVLENAFIAKMGLLRKWEVVKMHYYENGKLKCVIAMERVKNSIINGTVNYQPSII